MKHRAKTNYDKDIKIVLYSPVYHTSPGTQMRIDLIRKSLSFYGVKTIFIHDEYEGTSQKIYHSSLTENILTKPSFWYLAGIFLARRLCRYSRYSNTIILFMDICASALPYLRRCFDKIILSVEDLTPHYKQFRKDSTRKYLKIFIDFVRYADYVITPAHTLTNELKELGLNAHTVPIGLEPYTSLKEALNRSLPIKILHAGQLSELEQIKAILYLIRKYTLIVHNYGRYAKLFNNLNHPNLQKYRAETLFDTIKIVKDAHIGLVISNRPAFTLSRLYFHVALLQPIIGKGVGPWIKELRELGLKLNPIDYEVIEEIINRYPNLIYSISEVQSKLKIPMVHKNFVENILKD